jgi:hypothetical protein
LPNFRWANPHDSDCEINIWVNGMIQVAPIKRPFNCGGGYKNQRFTATIPLDFPGCALPEDNCVMQIYAHSVEPRSYAIGIDFVLSGDPIKLNNTVPLRQPSTNPINSTLPNSKDVHATYFQRPILYSDAFDTSHVDHLYSFYRGQQRAFIRDNILAACQIQSYVGEGGLVPLGNVDKERAKKMREQVQDAIKEAEKNAILANEAAQVELDKTAGKDQQRNCFEGDLYGVVNNKDCNREYGNTYVTNVDYRAIFKQFLPKFKAAGLTPYSPRWKNTPVITPVDPYDSYKVHGKPSAVNKIQEQKDVQLRPPPPIGQQIPQPRLKRLKPAEPINPPLEADFYTGPDDVGATGKGQEGAPGQKVPLNGQIPKTDGLKVVRITFASDTSSSTLILPTPVSTVPAAVTSIETPSTTLYLTSSYEALFITAPGYLPIATPERAYGKGNRHQSQVNPAAKQDVVEQGKKQSAE